METLTENKETLDHDAREILDCAEDLDMNGICFTPPCEGLNEAALRKARETVQKHLRDLASLIGEIKKDGFTILILNQKSNEKRMTPGAVRIGISKERLTETIYRQEFNSFFLNNFFSQGNFRDPYPDKESLKRKIAESKAKVEERLQERRE